MVADGGGISRIAAISFVSDESSSRVTGNHGGDGGTTSWTVDICTPAENVTRAVGEVPVTMVMVAPSRRLWTLFFLLRVTSQWLIPVTMVMVAPSLGLGTLFSAAADNMLSPCDKSNG